RVHVDAHQLELTLLNLALNSRDAMRDGGTITLAAVERDITADSVLPSGRYVCLSVTDTGIGMDAATLARATEPFFTTKGVGKGTGLGLSMAQGLAEQSGGRLELSSVLGRGTTVTLWLPVAAETQAQVPDAPQSEERETSGPPLRILVVDDDSLVLAQARAMLEELGHTVREACSGEEALGALSEVDSLDLLLTDYLMPGMTGLELTEAVRTRRPGMPILLMSAFADLPSGAPALSRLAKPFTLQQ
ncbi:MAG: response regulator, partial [Rhodospirillales bacterium]|nr:response regulator [Rhodospirillales bacterium]